MQNGKTTFPHQPELGVRARLPSHTQASVFLTGHVSNYHNNEHLPKYNNIIMIIYYVSTGYISTYSFFYLFAIIYIYQGQIFVHTQLGPPNRWLLSTLATTYQDF